MDYETKRPLIEKLDKCLLDHAVAAGTKEGGPDITDVYRLWGLSESHYYLKVEHDFKPDEVEALLQFSDPLTVARECWEERPPDKGFPICDLLREIKAYERFPLVDPEGYAQQKAEQLQLLKDRLDQNMSDFQTELLSMDKAEIIAKSAQITAMQEAHDFVKEDFNFSPDDVAVLLNMENPLKFIADKWPSDLGTLLDMEDQIREAIGDAGKEAVAQRDAEVVQALNDLLDKNMADFDAAISDMTAEEIAGIDEIASTREIYSFLRYDYEFEPRAAELLLRMENPLKLLVDNYPCFDLVELATKALANGDVEPVEKAESAQVESARHEPETAAVRGKPSVRGQLREAAREVNQRPPTADKAKSGEAR